MHLEYFNLVILELFHGFALNVLSLQLFHASDISGDDVPLQHLKGLYTLSNELFSLFVRLFAIK